MINRKFRISKQLWSSTQLSNLTETSKKETKQWLKLRNKKNAYRKERARQKKHLNKEIAIVNKLFRDGSISEDIHLRYLRMLDMGYEQKIKETRNKFGFPNT